MSHRPEMPMPPSRSGTVLLFLLGLITVMLITAFAFLRSMQLSASAMSSQRKDELARHAAELGMQHAIAVCMHEYAMREERRDGTLISGSDPLLPDHVATRPDGPSTKVFQPLSPMLNDNSNRQPPQAYDLPPDADFQYLFGKAGPKPLGWRTGYTSNRGVARWHEANRWDYVRTAVFDPASYDDYDPSPARAPDYEKAALPVAGGLQSPFPPVDPFASGTLNLRAAGDPRHNPLDNPLLLDVDCRPVSDIAMARYRLRYAITTYDMSAALWMNTDMPWLDDLADPASTRKQDVRTRYRDVIGGMGMLLPGIDMNAAASGSYRGSLESVFLGYGPITNSQFLSGRPGFQDGVPYDWATRNPDGFAVPGAPQPMAYRTDQSGADPRWFHSVLGSPYMNAYDPGRRWLGSAIAGFTDLSFALSQWSEIWERDGQNPAGWTLYGPLAAAFGQRAATPFGRPHDGGEHPWAVNILSVSPRVLQAMVQAFVPPAARNGLVTTESQYPRYRYLTSPGGPNERAVEGWATSAVVSPATADPPNANWKPCSWTVSASHNLSIPGNGIDLFTKAFKPGGVTPFAYDEPADRDYWGSPAARRPLLDIAQADPRDNTQRYPGSRFFSIPAAEPKANQLTRWFDTAARPWQAQDDAASTFSTPAIGSDHLGRHIIFYTPEFDFPAVAMTQTNVLGKAASNGSRDRYRVANTAITGSWDNDFSPTAVFGFDQRLGLYGSSSHVVYEPSPAAIVPGVPSPAPVTERYRSEQPGDFTVTPDLRPDVDNPSVAGWKIVRSSSGTGVALNSYWQRLTLAFYHAVLTTQTANLAYADPQDLRSRSISDANGGGPTYNPDATRTLSRVRKSAGGDPKAADFATVEQVDRQFLANLGESFDRPGTSTPADVCLGERPPRYLRNQARNSGNYPGPATFALGYNLHVAEYRVSNNIRTLLTPIDMAAAGAALTARSTDILAGASKPPRHLWLLDEWNAESESGYTPGTAVGDHPTRLARARAKLMERVLNDWRLSLLGSGRAYAPVFRPKDFDGDGQVFCSGYAGAASDADTGLNCWEPVEAGTGDGPGAPTLSVFSLTGSLVFTRSHQYKIQVRGELFDNLLNKAASESVIEGAILIDPDNDVVRSGVIPTGLHDSTLMMLHQVPNTYQGLLPRSYP